METATGAGKRSSKKITDPVKQEATPASEDMTLIEQETNHDDVNHPKAQTPPAIREVSLNDLVCVQSCFYGGLIYVSKKSGDLIEWNEFGTEQYMSVQELMYMRNTQPDFFRKQWIRLIGDNAEDVFNFLHLERYCKSPIGFENFKDIFELSVSDIEHTVSAFTPSMKESFARFAINSIQDETLNNLSVIKAIERSTGFHLMT